jgi:cytochrome d ubiquinol oxidase subunit I
MVRAPCTAPGFGKADTAMDALLLSRLQFAFTIAYHIIFPSFTIGLASFLTVLEAVWLITGRQAFLNLYRFWLKIFALSFGMGVVSGVVMSYEFGTNWSAFSARTAPVLGPLLAFEVLTAFFLEASFLGVMLFGWKKVGRKLHFTATAIVAFGTLVSAFWIISANSWMQHPVSFTIDPRGRMIAVDWLKVIFNPTFPSRYIHMVLAAYLTTALVVGAASAFQLLRDNKQPESKIALRMAIGMFALVAPLQLIVGDISGKIAEQVQPAKIAAVEGLWDSRTEQPFHILAWPDRNIQGNRWDVSIPKLGSFLLKGNTAAHVDGLKAFPRADQPPAALIFYSFRIMVGLGLAMIGLGVWGLIAWRFGGPERSRHYLLAATAMGPAGFVAVICGWITAEVGRQPYIVYGVMRTADAVSAIRAGQAAASLTGFLTIYAIVFSVGVLYILRLMAEGPAVVADHGTGPPSAPGSPLGQGLDGAPS